MFDRVPLRRARRIMTHRDLKPRLVGKLLQPLFVTTGTGSVAAARIRFDHQPFRLGVVVLPVSLPPVTEGICSQVWNVFRGRHADVAGVAFRIIDPIRHSKSFGIGTEVVIVDLLTFAAPRLAGVFELANQLFFLRVHADPRVARFAKRLTLTGDVAELFVAFGVMLAGVKHFAMAPHPQLLITQQPGDGGGTRTAIQLSRQAAQPRPHPLFLRARVARRFWIDTR